MSIDHFSVQYLIYMHARWPENSPSLSKLHFCRSKLSFIMAWICLIQNCTTAPIHLHSNYLEMYHDGHQDFTEYDSCAQKHFRWPIVIRILKILLLNLMSVKCIVGFNMKHYLGMNCHLNIESIAPELFAHNNTHFVFILE